MKRVISVLITISILLSVFSFSTVTASAITYGSIGDFGYFIENDEVTIINCNIYAKGDIVIPEKIENYPVTNIRYDTFSECEYITSVTIPQGIKTIQSHTFDECISLKKINIPTSVNQIENGAFRFCESLTDITLPEGITEIPNWCFYGCYSLEEINIPQNVESIGEYAFGNCVSLSDISLPSKITIIPESCFYDCDSLTQFTVPEGIIRIEDDAFYDCENLEILNLPSSLKVFNISSFFGSDSLKSINVSDENEYYSSLDGILYNKTQTEVISFPPNHSSTVYTPPSTVKSFSDSCFEYCKNLEEVNIPDHVESLGVRTFYFCTNLKKVTFSSQIKTIPEYCFFYCVNLTEITLPENLLTIGDAAFSITSLKTIHIPQYVQQISGAPFDSNTDLTAITVSPQNEYFTAIDGILYNHDVMQIIAYPQGKKNKYYALPKGITRIGDDYNPFSYNEYLTGISISNSLCYVDYRVFEKCVNLKNVWYSGSEGYKNTILKVEDNNDYFTNAKWTYNCCEPDKHIYTDKYDNKCNKCSALRDAVPADVLKKGNDNKWYYYYKGVKTNATKLINHEGKWFYIKNGVWAKSTNTLIKHSGKWFYVVNGKWSTAPNTLIKFNGKWFYIKNGKWDSTAKTLFKYKNKWFYIKSGKWSKTKAIVSYNGKKFYVNGGITQLSYSGKVTISGKTYKIKNGKVV